VDKLYISHVYVKKRGEGKGSVLTCHAPSPTTPIMINMENVLTLSFVLSAH